MCRSVLPSIALICAVVVTSSAFGQDSSREDFEEWCEIMEGRYVGDVTLIADWPGIGAKGDKITAHVEIVEVADDHALMGKWYAGDGTSTWLAVYDAGTKKIKELTVTSGGTVFEAIIRKRGDTWVQTIKGSNADGSKLTGKNTITITDNGKTHTWTGTTTIEGQETQKLHDVYRRVAD